MDRHMPCAYCGRLYQYPDGFAKAFLAECWRCAIKPLEDEVRSCRSRPWWRKFLGLRPAHNDGCPSQENGA